MSVRRPTVANSVCNALVLVIAGVSLSVLSLVFPIFEIDFTRRGSPFPFMTLPSTGPLFYAQVDLAFFFVNTIVYASAAWATAWLIRQTHVASKFLVLIASLLFAHTACFGRC